jgi:hypothetical protein
MVDIMTIKSFQLKKKESYRWIEGLQETHRFSQDHAVKFVTVADRECDVYEFLHEAQELGEDFVIRAAEDRRTIDHSYTHSPENKIWYKTETSPIVGEYQVKLGRDKKDRISKFSVRVCQLTLKAATRKPTARSKKLSPVDVTCILAREINPPKDVEAIEWMLLTNMKIKNFADVCEKISWYEKRWTIESFHKVLKSGFNAERCQLKTPERLYRFIATISVLAVRLYQLSHYARQNPLDSCEIILKEHEWRSLEHKIKGKANARGKPPNLSDAITWVAILGGYLNRKSDPPPGSMVIWRGWKRLQDISEAWLIFQETCG